MTPDLLWKLGRVSGSSLSPDGKWILYGVSYYDITANKGNRDLYLVSINGGDPKKITSFKGSEFNEFWKPDGKAISISGPPDVDYANETGLNWLLKNVMRLLSFKIKRLAKILKQYINEG